jgi:hypothetical protein
MCQRIGNADPIELYQVNIDSSKVVDLHYYNLFDPYFDNLTGPTGVQNIQYVYSNRVACQLETLNYDDGPLVFISNVIFWFHGFVLNIILILGL